MIKPHLARQERDRLARKSTEQEQIAELQAEVERLKIALTKAGSMAEYDNWPIRHPRVYGAIVEALGIEQYWRQR